MRHKNRKYRKGLKSTRKMRKNGMKHRRMSMRHSRRSRGRRMSKSYRYRMYRGKTFRGGSGLRSLLPMEITSLGDNIRHGISTVAHDFVGSVYDPPSPLPYRDHQIDKNDNFVLPKVADVSKIYNEASSKVQGLYS